MRLKNILIVVSDIEKSKKFYKDLFGLEVILDGDTSIYLFDESFDATKKSLYKITYNTELDGLIGPITFYVDNMSGIVIGADYRE